jgi:hypothetical protein
MCLLLASDGLRVAEVSDFVAIDLYLSPMVFLLLFAAVLVDILTPLLIESLLVVKVSKESRKGPWNP